MIKYSYMELRINPFSPRGAGKHATCTFMVHVFVNQLALKKNHKKKWFDWTLVSNGQLQRYCKSKFFNILSEAQDIQWWQTLPSHHVGAIDKLAFFVAISVCYTKNY